MRHHIENIESAHADRVHKLEHARLPLRHGTSDAPFPGDEGLILPDVERLALARRFGPVAMKITHPLHSYRGVAIRILQGASEAEDHIAVVLSHKDGALEVSLYEAEDDSDVIAEWRKWGNALGLPLLMEGADGHLVAAENRLGEVAVEHPRPRRRGSFLSTRRPRFLIRRRAAKLPIVPFVHRDEREIIAAE